MSRRRPPRLLPWCLGLFMMPAVLGQFDRTRSFIDRVYELEGQLPPADGDEPLSDEVAQFTKERMKAAAAFIASLYLTAWQDSAKIELPAWHRARTMPRAPQTQPGGPPSIEVIRGGVFYPTRATITQ